MKLWKDVLRNLSFFIWIINKYSRITETDAEAYFIMHKSLLFKATRCLFEKESFIVKIWSLKYIVWHMFYHIAN